MYDTEETLCWLRECRSLHRATIHANLPITVHTAGLFEAICSRGLHELIRYRREKNIGDRALLGELRAQIEAGRLFSKKLIEKLGAMFPAENYPRCAAFWRSETHAKLNLLFVLRNLAAHSGAVWIDFRVGGPTAADVEYLGLRREDYTELFDLVKAQGFSISNSGLSSGLTEVFSHNEIVDAQCRAAWTFFKEFYVAFRADALLESGAFFGAGIVWPTLSIAFTGQREWLVDPSTLPSP